MAIRKPTEAQLRPTEEDPAKLIAEIDALHAQILKRRRGRPVDADKILDEMRGYQD